MGMIERSSCYRDKYGAWAGRPKGNPPDYARCCEQVWASGRFSHAHQCTKARGHGPDGAYCKQHDPGAVAARKAATAERYKAAWDKRTLEVLGPQFYDVLLKIAEGHNDPRGLAQEAIDKFNKGR